jgi:GNAT superfamily N-acetyltransferase
MFWKGKVSAFKQLYQFARQSEVSLIELDLPNIPRDSTPGGCKISICRPNDAEGTCKLLNEWFEDPDSKTRADTTVPWFISTFSLNHAIWIIAKDSGGTIRGCVGCFYTPGPYPNSLEGCGKMQSWGLIDWFCVHPLWRSKGVGSALLETVDFISYAIGRKALVFLKEGIPLPLPHIPVYTTWLKCRKAGNPLVKRVNNDIRLSIYPYYEVERSTGIPMIRVDGVVEEADVKEWEDTLDQKIPECLVFVSGSYIVDPKKGWKTDSMVSMYAFRWSPGKWLGCKPHNYLV